MCDKILQTKDLITSFRQRHASASSESITHLNEIFGRVESIMLTDGYDDSIVGMVIAMNLLCQSDVGLIGQYDANQLYTALNNFVTEGIGSSLTPALDGDVQLTIKLQLLLFFMQRLFACTMLLGHHLGNSEQLQCLSHICILRGYLSTLSAEYDGAKESFVPKVEELYRKLIRENFALAHHCSMLRSLDSWICSTEAHPLLASKRIYALLGGAYLAVLDLERIAGSKLGSAQSADSRTAIVCVEICLRAIEGLTCLFCGRVPDLEFQRITKRVASALCSILGSLYAANKASESANLILAHLFSSSLGICLPLLSTMTGVTSSGRLRRDGVRASWGRLFLVAVFADSGLRRDLVQTAVILVDAVLTAPADSSHLAGAMATTCRSLWIAAVAVKDDVSALALHKSVWNRRMKGVEGIDIGTHECLEQFLRHAAQPPSGRLTQVDWGTHIRDCSLRFLSDGLQPAEGVGVGVCISMLAGLRRTHVKRVAGRGAAQIVTPTSLGLGRECLLPIMNGLLQHIRVLIRFSLKLASPRGRKKRDSNGKIIDKEFPSGRLQSIFQGVKSIVDCLIFVSRERGPTAPDSKCHLDTDLLECCGEICSLADICCSQTSHDASKSKEDGEDPRKAAACCATMVDVCMGLVAVYVNTGGATPQLVKCRDIFGRCFECARQLCVNVSTLTPADRVVFAHHIHVISATVVKCAVEIVDTMRDPQARSQLSQLFPSNCLPYINAHFQLLTMSLMQASQRVNCYNEKAHFEAALVEAKLKECCASIDM